MTPPHYQETAATQGDIRQLIWYLSQGTVLTDTHGQMQFIHAQTFYSNYKRQPNLASSAAAIKTINVNVQLLDLKDSPTANTPSCLASYMHRTNFKTASKTMILLIMMPTLMLPRKQISATSCGTVHVHMSQYHACFAQILNQLWCHPCLWIMV